MVLAVENPPANAGDIRVVGLITGPGKFRGGGHGILACRIPWTEGHSPWGRKELDMTEQLSTHT